MLSRLQPGDDDGDAEADGADDSGSQQPTEAGSKRQRTASDLRESDTLTDADSIRMKPMDMTFDVDPLFHRLSALFDEGGVQGNIC